MPGLVKSQSDIRKRKTNLSEVVVRNTRLRLVFILVFVQVKHQADLLDLGKNGRIKFQIKELFMYCPL